MLRLQLRVNHVGKRHKERPAEHEVRDDSQNRERNRKTENKQGQRHPFDTAQIGGKVRLRSRVNGLKESLAENPMIDDRPIHEPSKTRRTIDLAFPLRGAGRAKENKMPETEERFGFSIPLLLLSESGQREAPVVPDNSRRTKADDLALLLQTPAKIHIIASLAVLRIKSTDFLERPLVKSHV